MNIVTEEISAASTVLIAAPIQSTYHFFLLFDKLINPIL
jgi:hypothetical protein